jgi:hypothetical protein
MDAELDETLQYLGSSAAHAAIDANVYWPKWNTPWWRLSLLHEMGEIRRAPSALIEHVVEALDESPLKIFPIHPGEIPSGADPHLSVHCHCALGNMYQILFAWGVDVDGELPWIREWFLRYQMSDGGLNCDEAAYAVAGECPSSMVGTIAPFEAVLECTSRPHTPEELEFLRAGARFLIARQLRLGSPTSFNAAERKSAEAWPKLCFPRFYFYDVLRGLRALVRWAEMRGTTLPATATSAVVEDLQRRFPDGMIRIGRRAYEGIGTRAQTETGEWVRGNATTFPLLDRVSVPGEVSVFLSRQWAAIQRLLEGGGGG